MLDHDPAAHTTGEPHLNDLIQARISRRAVMGGGIAAAAAFLAGGNLFTGTAGAATATASAAGGPGAKATKAKLGFTAIPTSTDDVIHVPAGYTARVFLPWGTPTVGSYPAFQPGSPNYVLGGGNTAADQAQQIGMHHDGMQFFPLDKGAKGSTRGLLVINHEYTDESFLHAGQFFPAKWVTDEKNLWTLEMVRKSQNAHGVSITEIEKTASGEWRIVKSSRNRRIMAQTPMAFSGPAAGHRLLRTTADPAGKKPLGTMNNCAMGYTPWGTYLTCEENFNGYFRLDKPSEYDGEHAKLNTRYGIGGDRNNWATKDDRFVVTPTAANEPNRFGWVVEIDPFDPKSTPVKRTALGRLKHEGAFIQVAKGGRVVAYMGDDQVNEFVYKFVSKDNWQAAKAKGKSPLDEGTLYVAKFNDDGTGSWIPLVQGGDILNAANGFAD